MSTVCLRTRTGFAARRDNRLIAMAIRAVGENRHSVHVETERETIFASHEACSERGSQFRTSCGVKVTGREPRAARERVAWQRNEYAVFGREQAGLEMWNHGFGKTIVVLPNHYATVHACLYCAPVDFGKTDPQALSAEPTGRPGFVNALTVSTQTSIHHGPLTPQLCHDTSFAGQTVAARARHRRRKSIAGMHLQGSR